MNVDVNDRGNYVVIEFNEYIQNGWATVGCVRRKIDLDKEQVESIVEKLSEWLKKQAEMSKQSTGEG